MPLRRAVGKAFLLAAGWQVAGNFPGPRRAVLVAAPHTSNWDFVYMVAVCMSLDVRISFVAKHTLFWGPLGWLLRWMGGIPVRRGVRSNTVHQLAAAFRAREDLVLAIPPEGTRRLVPHWRSGFYHLAREANVPVVLGYLDYGKRRGGFGPSFLLSGDVRADMDRIRAFYGEIAGRFPASVGPVRLAEEISDTPGAV